MKALSIKQPWAWLICTGYKDIENRDWRIGLYGQFGLQLPARVYVHAGKTVDEDIPTEMLDLIDCKLPDAARKDFWRMCDDDGWGSLLGAIIGEVTITGCVERSDSPWFVGRYGFTLADAKLYDKPLPYRGQLGFFEVKL